MIELCFEVSMRLQKTTLKLPSSFMFSFVLGRGCFGCLLGLVKDLSLQSYQYSSTEGVCKL